MPPPALPINRIKCQRWSSLIRQLISQYLASLHFLHAINLFQLSDFNQCQIYYERNLCKKNSTRNIIHSRMYDDKKSILLNFLFHFWGKEFYYFRERKRERELQAPISSDECIFTERITTCQSLSAIFLETRRIFLSFSTISLWNMADRKLIQIGRGCNSKIIQQLPLLVSSVEWIT